MAVSAMPYHLGPLLGFDTETTGKNPLTARIVTASVAYQADPAAPVSTMNWVADAGGEDIPEEAAAIHGYTTDRVRAEGEPVGDVTVALVKILCEHMARGLPVVAFNAAYDFTVMAAEMGRLGGNTFNDILGRSVGPIIDPHVMDKAAQKYRKGKRTLEATAALYGIGLENAHTAAGDAEAALQLARTMPYTIPKLGAPAHLVHDWCMIWRAKQAAELQEYFRGQGKPDARVNGEWPIQTWQEAS